jgi:hypothetical protein
MSTSIKPRWPVGALVLAGVVSLAGCEGAVRATVFVPGPPPAEIRETVVASPGPGYVWIRGHHQWDGGRYLWVAGRWEQPPHRHAKWKSGRWQHNHQGWYWIEGRWR